MSQRGGQRSLPYPRDDRPTDFLFTLRGARIGTSRIRRGLEVAAQTAGLRGRDAHPLRITPHQLRHLRHPTGQRRDEHASPDGAAWPRHPGDDTALHQPGQPHHPQRLRHRDGQGPLAPTAATDRRRPPRGPDRIQWLHTEILKTRVAHGYCSRYLTADACPYANICEQCDNFTTSTEFLPQLHAQLTNALALREDAQARGWDSEVARHARVITSLQRHLDRLRNETQVSRRN